MTREHRLDALRGLLLVIMTVDHVGGPITALTYQTFGFMSAAGGFFLLSGYVAGMVYTVRLQTRGPDVVRRGARSRAWLVYRYHVALLITTLAIVALAPAAVDAWRTHQPTHFDAPVTKMVMGALLVHTDRFGVLRLYVFFIALIPVLVRACHRGREKAVVGTSLSLWFAVQLGLQEWLGVATGLGQEVFSPLSWQVVFVAGIVVGCRRARRGRRLSASEYDRRWLTTAAVLAVVLFTAKWATFAAYHAPIVDGRLGGLDELIAAWTERSTMAPLRLVNIAAITVLVGWGLAARSSRPSGLPWLQLIGRHSLQVYVFQAALVEAWWLIEGPAEQALGTAGVVLPNLVAVSLLTLPAVLHERWQARTRAGRDPAVAVAAVPSATTEGS